MPWTAKQHLWKSKAKEGYQVSRDGPSNRQKKDIKNCVTHYVVPCSVNFKINGRLRLLAQSIVSTCLSEKGKYPRVGTLFIYM